MGMNDFSANQQKIIKRYYQNIDAISLQKLSETVTELYLADGKKRERLWKNAAAAMAKMGVTPARIDGLVKADKPELLAELVQEMQGNLIRTSKKYMWLILVFRQLWL